MEGWKDGRREEGRRNYELRWVNYEAETMDGDTEGTEEGGGMEGGKDGRREEGEEENLTKETGCSRPR